MIELTLEELKERITNQLDPDELIELLGISMENLVDALCDYIEDDYEKLSKILEE